jgi:hypothetical protein
MSIQLNSLLDEAPDAEASSGLISERIRSFRLAPVSTGVRSFCLADNPFMKRRVVLPTSPSEEPGSSPVRSFRLASSSTGARSFRLTFRS